MIKLRDRAALADRLLDATLAQVPFEGWTSLALRAAAAETGVDWGSAKRIFPGGIGDVLALWGARNDQRMIAALADIDLGALRIRERIAACVRVRLEALEPHREAVRAALCRAGLPHNAPAAARSLWRTVDLMWRAAGEAVHVFTHFRLTLTVMVADLAPVNPERGHFVPEDALRPGALPTAMRKVHDVAAPHLSVERRHTAG